MFSKLFEVVAAVLAVPGRVLGVFLVCVSVCV